MQQHEADARRFLLPTALADVKHKQGQAIVRLPPPPSHLAVAVRGWQQNVQVAEREQRQLVERLHSAMAATPLGGQSAPTAAAGLNPSATRPAVAGQPATGWVAWRAGVAAAASGSEEPAVHLRPPSVPAEQQNGTVGSVDR